LAKASNSISIKATIVKTISKASNRIFFFREIIPLIGIDFSEKSLVYTWFLGLNSGLNKPIL
jgi:hypothetical protein